MQAVIGGVLKFVIFLLDLCGLYYNFCIFTIKKKNFNQFQNLNSLNIA